MPKTKRNSALNNKSNSQRGKKVANRAPVGKIVRVILIVITIGLLVGLIYWAMERINNVLINILSTFGLGLIIMAIGIITLIYLIKKHGASILINRWNRILGIIILAIAFWGILSFFYLDKGILSRVTLGGTFGRMILGPPGLFCYLRLAGLLILSLICLIPGRLHNLGKKLSHSKGMFSRRLSGVRKEQQLQLPNMAEIIQKNERMRREEEVTASRLEETPISQPSQPVSAISEQKEPVHWQSQREPILTSGGWQLPPIDILEKPKDLELNREDINKRAKLIEEALSSYGVEAKVGQINVGPTVTQFGIEPGWDRKYKKVMDNGEERLEEVSKTRIRVDRITNLANDLALALAAPSIRIEAPVPGKSVVGIEVPNSTFGSVSLRSVIESTAYQKIRARSKLAIAMGKGAGGEASAADLARMPHVLIAGATGSGKTICLDSIICCLLLHGSPDDVRFIMVDPKRVELIIFNGIPHLITPVIVDSNKAVKALRWLNQEMDNRYRLFAKAGARNIEAYNKDRPQGESMPYLILVIDELADLMMTAFDEVERTLCRLAQLARATGIHLIVATQRPSVDVVTGLIKANFPSRISFAVTSQVDSRTILDSAGAEKLLGRGDMLYMTSESSRPKRLQGSYISDAEIQRMVYFWGNQGGMDSSLINFDEIEEPITLSQKLASGPDPLLEEVRNLAKQHEHISASFLQRRLHIGYPRAARLIDILEKESQDSGSAQERANKPQTPSSSEEPRH